MRDYEKTEKRKQKRNDMLLVMVLLVLAAILGGGYYWMHRIPAIRAEVMVDGELVETLDLSKNQEVTISGPGGGVNRLVVEDGKIWCEEASCPDKVCIRQGKQSQDGGQIVCLPNRMFVKVTGDEGGERQGKR